MELIILYHAAFLVQLVAAFVEFPVESMTGARHRPADISPARPESRLLDVSPAESGCRSAVAQIDAQQARQTLHVSRQSAGMRGWLPRDIFNSSVPPNK